MNAGAERVTVYDTTLRDGAQREGISWSLEDKQRIVRRLDALGVDLIEAGWPGSNPKDAELFAARDPGTLVHAQLAAFGATRRAGIAAEDDPQRAGAARCAHAGLHDLRQELDLARARGASGVARREPRDDRRDRRAALRAADRRVIYDAEHFFDGYAHDPAYALATLARRRAPRAPTPSCCATRTAARCPGMSTRSFAPCARASAARSGSTPMTMPAAPSRTRSRRSAPARRHVQGTINGYGERCGNANLCAVLPGIELKLGLAALPEGRLCELARGRAHASPSSRTSRPTSTCRTSGARAFAHKGGIHVAAMRRTAASYQHVDPALVGNVGRVVVSELSGRANSLSRADELGIAGLVAFAGDALAAVKQREAYGATFEAADASVAADATSPRAELHAAVRARRVPACSRAAAMRGSAAEATVKLRIGDRLIHTAAEGDGPVHALDAALRKALVGDVPRGRADRTSPTTRCGSSTATPAPARSPAF